MTIELPQEVCFITIDVLVEEVGIEHVNIPRSSPLEGEHTPTIIQLIRSTDLAVIQFKDSHIYSSYSNMFFIK